MKLTKLFEGLIISYIIVLVTFRKTHFLSVNLLTMFMK